MIFFHFNIPLRQFSIESKHEVTILGGLNEFCVKFYGPKGSQSIDCFIQFNIDFNCF